MTNKVKLRSSEDTANSIFSGRSFSNVSQASTSLPFLLRTPEARMTKSSPGKEPICWIYSLSKLSDVPTFMNLRNSSSSLDPISLLRKLWPYFLSLTLRKTWQEWIAISPYQERWARHRSRIKPITSTTSLDKSEEWIRCLKDLRTRFPSLKLVLTINGFSKNRLVSSLEHMKTLIWGSMQAPI